CPHDEPVPAELGDRERSPPPVVVDQPHRRFRPRPPALPAEPDLGGQHVVAVAKDVRLHHDVLSDHPLGGELAAVDLGAHCLDHDTATPVLPVDGHGTQPTPSPSGSRPGGDEVRPLPAAYCVRLRYPATGAVLTSRWLPIARKWAVNGLDPFLKLLGTCVVLSGARLYVEGVVVGMDLNVRVSG